VQWVRRVHAELPGGSAEDHRWQGEAYQRLVCDGLGACIGHCPQGAISTEEREAEAYDEKSVMETS